MSGQALTGACPVVFVSYSREDEAWRGRFAEMLKPLVRERRLEVWSDDRLVTGYAWRPQLAEAIGRARTALLLVSPSFLASDFIMDQELPALIQNGVQLMPVLVRPCLWQAVPVLEGLQWAHDPERDGPVSDSANQERQIMTTCLVLNELLAGGGAVVPLGVAGPTSAGPGGAVPVAAGARLGELHDVPPPPRAAVPREELAGLRAAVLAGGAGAVGVTGATLGIHGQGGIGKTVLAAVLARDEQVLRCFPDGVFWVTVGEQGDLVAAQRGLLARLGAADPGVRSAGQGAGLLRQVLAGRRCLLVVDDVWSAAAAAAFKVAGPAGRVLYTTRDPAVLAGVTGQVVELGVLPEAPARQLLAGLTGAPVLPAEADRIVAATGGVALALALVGAALGAGGQSWAQAAAQLETAGQTFLDHPYA
ncbi:MAG TPA: NB-ARC domain-containing protein, partial [Streptosporangiaceae bacterium]|nr:NB-ARC domain-containing protein [Streptosporangiaceae bacterium]